MSYHIIIHVVYSGVVGIFSCGNASRALWSHTLSLSGGGGGINLCSNIGGYFLDNGRYCNTSRLRCRSYGAYTALFNFIAREFEDMLFREIFFKNSSIGCILECILIYISVE